MRNLLCIILLVCVSAVSALDVQGHVQDANGTALQRVLITAHGHGTSTDADGFFRLKNLAPSDSLHFYKYGFATRHVPVVDCPDVLIMQTQAIAVSGITVHEEATGMEHLKAPQTRRIEVLPDAGSLAATLQRSADISINGADVQGGRQTISLRGHDPRHTLVLLDGMPLNRPGEAFDISGIPTEILETIEVFDAGGSAYVGSGAIGGAVNLITRKTNTGDTVSITTTSSVGSFNAYSNALDCRVQKPWIALKLHGILEQAKNDFSYTNSLTSPSTEEKRKNNESSAEDARWAITLPRMFSLHYQGSYRHYDKGLPGQVGQITLYENAAIQGIIRHHQLTASDHTHLLQWDVSLFHSNEESTYRNPPSLHTSTDYSRDGASGSLTLDPLSWLHANSGLEYGVQRFEYRHMSPLFSILPVWMQSVAPFGSVSLEQSINSFTVSGEGALRHDMLTRSDDLSFNDCTSWSGHVKMQHHGLLEQALSLHLDRSFSIPSFYDLYWKGGSQALGNPQLKPEKSRLRRIDYELSYADHAFSCSYQDARITNLIHWYRSVQSWKPGNIASSRISSFSLQATVAPLSWWNISLDWMRSYTADRSRLDDGSQSNTYGLELPYHPSSQTVVSSSLHPGPVELTMEYRRTGSQWPLRTHDWGKLDAYELYSVKASYRFSISSQLGAIASGSVQNLLDTHYQRYLLDPAPGRTISALLEISYKK